VVIWKKLTAEGCVLALAGPRDAAREVLAITQLDTIIPMHPSRDEAVRALSICLAS
jgi:anti-anti-sigma regulatory factor